MPSRCRTADAQLHLGNGWFQGMTLNAIQPTPGTETGQA
jgi:hypothetical protein